MVTRRLDGRAVIGAVAVLVIWAVAYGAVQLAASGPGGRTVALAAMFDASVTASVALYLIAVRRGHLPRWTLALTAGGGLWLARLGFGGTPDVARVVLAASATIELAFVGLMVWRVRRAVRAWRASRGALLERLTAMFETVGFPARVAAIAATELTIMAAVVTGWRRPASEPARFTVHRANGWSLYAGVFVFLTVVEAVAVHVVLWAYVSNLVAWIVTGLTIYSALWVIGDALALRHGGVVIEERGLRIAIGARCRGHVPWASVEAIERGAAPAGSLDLGILGANVVLRLREPVTVLGMFGRRRTASVVALSIDEPERWVAAAEAAIGAPRPR